jgi:hypothetical protein
MKVRFLADANLDARIVDGVCRRESLLDFQSAHEAALTGKSDIEVLEIAASAGRLLVTHDHRTMPAIFGQFVSNRHSSVVLIVPKRLGIKLAVEDLLLVWSASEAEEWSDRIVFLPF